MATSVRIVLALGGLLLAGCGAQVEIDDNSPTEPTEPNPIGVSRPPQPTQPSPGVRRCVSAQSSVDSACTCLDIHIQTQESCSMSIVDGHTIDGEGFIEIDRTKRRVFAMSRWSKGHVMAWCDGTTNKSLIDSFEVQQYLGQKAKPKMAAFGYGVLCGPGFVPPGTTFLGGDLPEKYKDNAAGLATDYDAVVFCGFGIPWRWDFSKELVDYVTVYGRGLLLSMDYVGPPGLATETDFDKMNVIANQAGISFDKTKLPWATASLDARMDCVPDVPNEQ